jgi:DNA polymerase-4
MERVILHVDMDAFFAAIEQLDRPEWRGRPVIVGSPAPRGVVSAASYEARAFGVHSAMPGVTAKRLCPDAVWAFPRFARYAELSERFMDVVRRYSPIVDPVSIDEASADLTGTERLFGDPVSIARRIKDEIRAETGGLTGSVGMGPNRFVAKIASELEKPDGLVYVPKARIPEVLYPLPIRRVWGVGPKSEKQFLRLGIDTIGKLARVDPAFLDDRFGMGTSRLRALVAGEEIELSVDRDRKSVSRETTFATDVGDRAELDRHLRLLAEDVCRRLRAKGLRGRTVRLKVRFGDFTTITRARSLPARTCVAQEVVAAAFALLDRITPLRPVRLIGVGLSGLVDAPEPQVDLFDTTRRARERAAAAMDEANRRFGRSAVVKADLHAVTEEDDGDDA